MRLILHMVSDLIGSTWDNANVYPMFMDVWKQLVNKWHGGHNHSVKDTQLCDGSSQIVKIR